METAEHPVNPLLDKDSYFLLCFCAALIGPIHFTKCETQNVKRLLEGKVHEAIYQGEGIDAVAILSRYSI